MSYFASFQDQQLNSMIFQALKMKFLHFMTFQVFPDLYKPDLQYTLEIFSIVNLSGLICLRNKSPRNAGSNRNLKKIKIFERVSVLPFWKFISSWKIERCLNKNEPFLSQTCLN